MIYQNDANAPRDFQKYACRFLSLYMAKVFLKGEPITLESAVSGWSRARTFGYISGDLNRDGDYDDPGEDEMLNDEAIFRLLDIPLEVVNPKSLGLTMAPDRNGIMRIQPTREPLDLKKYYVLEAWHWKITHFVVGNGAGMGMPIYDPIEGGSLTRRNGALESLRVYKRRDK